jgi:hypothetical protein
MTPAELRAQVLATANPQPMPVLGVPGWAGVHIRPLLVGEVEAIKPIDGDAYRVARGLARVLCTADGALLFDATSDDDLRHINGLPASVLGPLNRVAESVNASTAEDAEALGNG